MKMHGAASARNCAAIHHNLAGRFISHEVGCDATKESNF
jgi:hypothetical protein